MGNQIPGPRNLVLWIAFSKHKVIGGFFFVLTYFFPILKIKINKK